MMLRSLILAALVAPSAAFMVMPAPRVNSVRVMKPMVYSTAPSTPVDNTPAETTTEVAAVAELTPEEEEAKQMERSVRFSWLLSLNSGVLNGVFLSGILGKVQACGPVTDSWTKNALCLATGDMGKAAFIAQVLVSFSLGAFIVGLINPKQGLYDLTSRKKPLALAGLAMAASATLCYTAFAAGATKAIPLAFFLVSMANGMQNSFSSFATANMCRTSHMTGTTTDLATIIASCLRGNTEKKYRIRVYSGLIAFFWAGGFIGTRWTNTLGKAAIVLASSSAFYLLSAIPSAVPKKILSVFKKKQD